MSPENLRFDDDDDRPTTPIVYLAREPRPLVMFALPDAVAHEPPAEGFDEREERFFASEALVTEMWARAREIDEAEERARRAHDARYAARRARAQLIAKAGVATVIALSAAALILGG
ncbi:MAG: hypothetical protein JNL38_15765 [Myxococcales bacterium]|nr:hypothetical protein [Myxococcales bacterium]